METIFDYDSLLEEYKSQMAEIRMLKASVRRLTKELDDERTGEVNIARKRELERIRQHLMEDADAERAAIIHQCRRDAMSQIPGEVKAAWQAEVYAQIEKEQERKQYFERVAENGSFAGVEQGGES